MSALESGLQRGLPIALEVVRPPRGLPYFKTTGTLSDYLRLGTDPKPANVYNAERWTRLADQTSTSEDWFGLPHNRTMRLQKWPEGLEMAKAYETSMPEIQIASLKRKPRWADDGDDFSRERFDAGHDACWQSRRRTRVSGRPTIIRITCEIGGSCTLRPEQLAYTGAAMFALADAAEKAGYRAVIEAMYFGLDPYTNLDANIMGVVRVKESDQPLDREAAITAMACPAFFRYYMLASMLAVTSEGHIRGGYGIVGTVPTEYHGDLHMPRVTDTYTAASTLAELVRKLENTVNAGAQAA